MAGSALDPLTLLFPEPSKPTYGIGNRRLHRLSPRQGNQAEYAADSLRFPAYRIFNLFTGVPEN